MWFGSHPQIFHPFSDTASSLELFSSGRRCCRRRRRQTVGAFIIWEALLDPLRIVPPLLAVARSSELSSWCRRREGFLPSLPCLICAFASYFHFSKVVVAACIGFDVCAKELTIDQP
ncbi:hypothetical protein AAHE18_17G153500 [Arachis hypogaea]